MDQNKLKVIEFDREEKYIRDFLNLAKKLYKPEFYCENVNEVREILLEEHVLSKYFSIRKLLVYYEASVVARCILTEYEGDSNLYIGYFEAVKNKKASQKLFSYCEALAKENSYKKLVGPVDASFWIKYRLKMNLFEIKPYVGEPYNREYYPDLFYNGGFELSESYNSVRYINIPRKYHDKMLDRIYSSFIRKGFVIKSVKAADYDKCIEEIFYLMSELYSGFPLFKKIDKADFLTCFNKYRYILDFRFVKMAYYKGKAVGFFVAIPNYSNYLYHITPANLIRAAGVRFSHSDYVLMYMGSLVEYRGLGFALAASMLSELERTGAKSIGALSHNGRSGKSFARGLQTDQYEYGLFSKTII